MFSCSCLQHTAAAWWGVQLPRAEAGAWAGCSFYASEEVSVYPKLLLQPGVVQDVCFLQAISILWQQRVDGQSRRCGRCVCSAITAAVILYQRVVGRFCFVKKTNGKCEVMSVLKRTARKRNTYVLWLATWKHPRVLHCQRFLYRWHLRSSKGFFWWKRNLSSSSARQSHAVSSLGERPSRVLCLYSAYQWRPGPKCYKTTQ